MSLFPAKLVMKIVVVFVLAKLAFYNDLVCCYMKFHNVVGTQCYRHGVRMRCQSLYEH